MLDVTKSAPHSATTAINTTAATFLIIVFTRSGYGVRIQPCHAMAQCLLAPHPRNKLCVWTVTLPTITEDIARFLALHHRLAELTPEERAEYDALRRKVVAAMQSPEAAK
jgi:hypothetical protein